LGLAAGQDSTPKNVSPQAVEFFETRIRPLLVKNCFACHTNARSGGLQLDSRESILKGGNSGPAVVPGDPDHSLLVQAVRHTQARLKMPPPGKLPETDIADLAAWVKAGAIWGETAPPIAGTAKSGEYIITPRQKAFWAFQPVHKPAVPPVTDTTWPKNAIDRFILAKLEQNGLRPVAPADKRILLRRATLDLTGLPPTSQELDEFLSDSSPDAFAKVVDRLLASPHYGERWGRHWLDLARYADGKLGASKDTPYRNAFRYRDWVIQAFNEDMPYDKFVKAQIAADLMPDKDREKLLPGLGFQSLGDGPDDEVDVSTRTFLAMTVGCARCHDHKYDPIPTRDYYSLLGIFKSSQDYQIPLAPETEVAAYKEHKKKIDQQQEQIDDFVVKQSTDLGQLLVRKTARYLESAWKVLNGNENCAARAAHDKLDPEILERWIQYLKDPNKDHPYLKARYEATARGDKVTSAEVKRLAADFQALALSIFDEKKAIDDRNYVKLGGAKGAKDEKTRQYTNLESLPIEKYYLWRDLASEPYMRNGLVFPGGVYYYGFTSTLKKDFETRGGQMPEPKDIDRFLQSEWKEYLVSMRAELTELKRTLPPEYPFLHALKDKSKPENTRVAIRGNPDELGEEAPRRFLQILSDGKAQPFTKGSGRLELAEAIADPSNPLTARVMVNRIWQWHFGRGIVASPGNFGLMGERPTHPELLDYLAARFIESGCSVKALHREIMLSAAYALSSLNIEPNAAKDPENRLLWRGNFQLRVDAEVLRDSLLAVAGQLDLKMGGAPKLLTDDNRRRAVYGYIGRTELDPMLALFDFPSPNTTSEQRMVTAGPLQRLWFMNSSFVTQQAQNLADRLNNGAGLTDEQKIRTAYRLLFGRAATESEMQFGLQFLKESHSWPVYAQALLCSSEFSSVN
jgi:hypothetical protein